jgi:hypothetical protein
MNPKGNMFLNSFSSLSLGLPVYLFYTYFTVYKIIPVTLFRRKIFLLVLYLFLASLICAFLLRLNSKFLFYRFFDARNIENIDLRDWFPVLSNMVWVNVPLFMFASVKYIYNYYLEESKKRELEKENLQAELSLLMVQLRPHFLFNTLNNLYSMALAGDPKTATGLSKISNLLKYILYECSEDRVELKKEINLIEDYVELELMRYDERLEFAFEKQIKDAEVSIVPMILFTFVENSFKHGSGPEPGKSFIHLQLSADREKMSFTAENSYPGLTENKSTNGLGLDNVRKRLDLLYPNSHNLVIDKQESVFRVELQIRFNED